MATIQQRKDSAGKMHYRVMVRVTGAPPQYATFDRRTDAQRWAAATESAVREGRYFKVAESRRHTVGDMIDRYVRDVLPGKKQSSRHSQEPRLLWWKQRLGQYVLADVTAATVAEARDALAHEKTRRGATHASSTVNHYLAALSHVFSMAIREWNWLEINPMAKVGRMKWPRGRVRCLDEGERQRLLDECRKSPNPCLYDIVVLALSSGMRYAEIMTLTWRDVDLQRGLIILENTKNGERRGIPLVGHALERMKERSRIRHISNPHVFPAPRKAGEHINIKTSWQNALNAAGIEDFHFHDLRHSAASYLAMNGATLAELATILGHKSLSMVKRYSHITDAHTSKVLERMAANIFQSASQQHKEFGDGK